MPLSRTNTVYYKEIVSFVEVVTQGSTMGMSGVTGTGNCQTHHHEALSMTAQRKPVAIGSSFRVLELDNKDKAAMLNRLVEFH